MNLLAAMPPKKAAKLRVLIQAVRQEKIKPSVVIADGKTSGTTLPKGVKGAYVAGANGRQGAIIIAPGLTAKEQKAVLAEKSGEAIADRASQLGFRIAPGDAGARAEKDPTATISLSLIPLIAETGSTSTPTRGPQIFCFFQR